MTVCQLFKNLIVEEIKLEFFQDIIVSAVLHSCNTWNIRNSWKKKLDGNILTTHPSKNELMSDAVFMDTPVLASNKDVYVDSGSVEWSRVVAFLDRCRKSERQRESQEPLS